MYVLSRRIAGRRRNQKQRGISIEKRWHMAWRASSEKKKISGSISGIGGRRAAAPTLLRARLTQRAQNSLNISSRSLMRID